MNAPYLVIPIALLLSILYGMTWLFSRLGVFSQSVHRRIWNHALLATFLATAVLGALMAVQVNYRIEVEWTEKVLKWHVNFGLAMSAVAFYHLLWHLAYYLPFKRKRDAVGRNRQRGGLIVWLARFTWGFPQIQLFMVGFTGIGFQFLMVREVLSQFQGNELTLSLVLFTWMITTSVGALGGNRAASKADPNDRPMAGRSNILILSLLILPFVLFPLLIITKGILFAPGTEAGPAALTGLLLLVTGPFCLLNGFSFTWILGTSLQTPHRPGLAYAWESLGGAAAGVAVTILLLSVNALPLTDRWAEQTNHPNEEIITVKNLPSGRISRTRSGDQQNLYQNGVLLQSSGNTLLCEEVAHFTLSQIKDPRKVLVIGGVLTGIHDELMKYPLERVDYAESDRTLLKMASDKEPGQPAPSRRRLLNKQPEQWLRMAGERYDAILVMLPGPQTLGLNRFYSVEFFRSARRTLNQGGVLSVMMPGTANYLSEEAIKAMGPVYAALASEFPHTAVMPGESSCLIGGSHQIATDILEKMDGNGISATYLTAGYFDERLFREKSGAIGSALSEWKAVNSSLFPRAFLGTISWWTSRFPPSTRYIAVLTGVAACILLVTLRRRSSVSLFLAGAAAAGSELIALLLLQYRTGALFLLAGILLAGFMAGSAAGSLTGSLIRTNSISRAPAFASATLVLAGLLLALSVVTGSLGGSVVWLTVPLAALSFLLAAFSVGWLFAGLSEQAGTGYGSPLYAADLLGGALGSLAFPLILLPAAGFLPSALLIALLGFLSLLLSTGRNR